MVWGLNDQNEPVLAEIQGQSISSKENSKYKCSKAWNIWGTVIQKKIIIIYDSDYLWEDTKFVGVTENDGVVSF